MVQVGTAKFDATKFCNLTTVSLAGSPKKWNETFVGDFSAINKKEVLEYSSDLARYSDGYTLTMEITAGQEIEANAMMGTAKLDNSLRDQLEGAEEGWKLELFQHFKI